MSQENVEIVRRVYHAMRVGDSSGVIEFVDPELEWIPDRRVGEGPIRGRESVIEFFTDRAAMFGQFDFELERFWEQDGQVLVFLRVSGSGAASGAGFEIHIAHLWTLRDGMLVRGEGFGDRAQALEAAGLSE
jgi:uncharacterized protein